MLGFLEKILTREVSGTVLLSKIVTEGEGFRIYKIPRLHIYTAVRVDTGNGEARIAVPGRHNFEVGDTITAMLPRFGKSVKPRMMVDEDAFSVRNLPFSVVPGDYELFVNNVPLSETP